MTKSSSRAANCLYDDKAECPILHVFKCIGGKWKLPVLWHLAEKETLRYNELKRTVRGVTNMMLTKCLRELEDFGLVHRMQYNEIPPRVEYSLTERGKTLLPALEALYAWGREHLDFAKDTEKLEAEDCGCQPRACPDSLVDSSLDGSADTSKRGSAA
ncbi:MAG TPA: helix-turn-helix domain-containing protein [Desulfovibrio sp.]|uniref:winged helix-turn-helix transcriptional regulator n=1 Tax=Desulfovibrio sp. TaxID=885 RepID=UPI002D2D41F2|nr:helix-turn-helix domain-containing protein [Desulfovibrio sp.]HZF61452.1 helix-turn-helix domain-containing protein [Desulfovibrio sp.]